VKATPDQIKLSRIRQIDSWHISNSQKVRAMEAELLKPVQMEIDFKPIEKNNK